MNNEAKMQVLIDVIENTYDDNMAIDIIEKSFHKACKIYKPKSGKDMLFGLVCNELYEYINI